MIIQQSLFTIGKPPAPAINTVTTTATGVTPTIPTHSAGQVIVICTGTDASSISVGSSTGTWVKEVELNTGSGNRAAVFSCAATGSNMSLTITSAASVLNHIIYVIDNANTVDAAAYSSGASTTSIDPPSLTIAAGANRDVLWIPFGWNSGIAWTCSGAPSGFSNLKTIVRSSPPRWGMATADLVETDVQTKNPGTFGAVSTAFWYATTVGIYFN